MSYNNQNSATCRFAEQIVSYLYDECAKDEKTKFEAHLKDCSRCADEYAGFGFVRSSVLEWRNEDFSMMTTPVFDIPANKNEKSPFKISTESINWLSGIRKLFSFNPALALAALGFLIICAGVTLFMVNFPRSNEIVENGGEKDSVKTIVTPTVEISKKPDDEKVIDIPGIKVEKSDSPLLNTNNLPRQKEPEKQVIPVKSVVKVSDNAAKNIPNVSAIKSKETNDRRIKPIKKQQVPNLNDGEDDEDETIRLADLFDELDTK